MKKVFIIHGFNGSPNGGWRPWLMVELAKHDIYACALPMPTPRYPIQEEWVKTVSEVIGNPDEEIFLVGHSLGVPTILRYLETLPKDKKIGGAVLVSGFINYVPGPGDRYDLINKFAENSFDFEHIKNVCKKFVVIHGDDDPIVTFSNAEELSNKLSCKLISFPNGKHLNGKAGIYELPEALDSLLKMINH